MCHVEYLKSKARKYAHVIIPEDLYSRRLTRSLANADGVRF